MAAYRAEIEIGVRGVRSLEELRSSINLTATAVDSLNAVVGARGGLVQNIQNYTNNLDRAARSLRAVGAGTSAETKAIREYVDALGQASAATERQNRLIQEEIDLRQASTVGARELSTVLDGLAEKQRLLENSQLDEKAARVQAELDRQAAAAAESANQIAKLNTRQEEFISRTDSAAQAAHRQTAEFIRQQRIAKEVAALNANAPVPQLLLPAAAPNAPAMSGGARRLITGPVERLGGARTQDEADTALRFAQALKEQVRPLSQIEYLYANIAKQAAALSQIKALPDSAMLNAAGRGIMSLETSQDRYNRELQESAQRLQQLDRLETARERRAAKLRQIADYYSPEAPTPSGLMPGRRKDPPDERSSRLGSAASNALIGGAFPLLFGQGAGAAAGGAIGGLVGELALGPGGGFGGSLIGTAVGAAADADQKIQKLAISLDLAGAAAASFGDSFRKSGADLQTFTQAVDQIRDLNVPFEQQATAIKLASAVSANYKGSITAVAGALKEIGSTGEVSVSTLNTLTKAGVPVVDSLARSFGVTKDKVIEMASEGKISVAQLTAKLAELGNQERPLTGLDKISQAFSSLTASANKLFGPLLNVLGNGLTTALEHVATWWTYLSEEAVPKFINAVSPIAEIVSKAFPTGILQKAGDIFLEIGIRVVNTATYLAAKLSPVLAAVVAKFIELSNNPVFKFIAEQVAKLAEMLGLNTAEVDKFRAKQEDAAGAAAKVTAAEQAKLNASLALNANLKERVAAMQAMQQISQASNAADKAELDASIQLLAQDKESISAINQIFAKKQEMAALDYAAAQQQAAFNVQEKQDALDKARIDQEGVATAEKNLNTAIAVASETLRGAAATQEAAVAAADLERRTNTAAAAMANMSISAAAATAALNEQANRVSNADKVYQSMAQAVITINNATIKGLEAELQRTESVAGRRAILEKIVALEKQNALFTYRATLSQIAAEVERVRIASDLAEIQAANAAYALATARANKVATAAHVEALIAARSAARIAAGNLETAIDTAYWLRTAAGATYDAAIAAANLRLETEGAASAAGNYANNLQRAATVASGLAPAGMVPGEKPGTFVHATTGGITVYDDASYQRAIAALGGGTNTAVKFGGIPGYTTQRDDAMSTYGTSSAGGMAPQININTGPIMQMNGSNYVTESDFQAGMISTANQTAELLMRRISTSASTRRNIGIR